MPSPLEYLDTFITNRAPAYGQLAGVQDYFRFSARDKATEILRNKLYAHMGIGSCFWSGGVLPEDSSTTSFTFKALSNAMPNHPAIRTIELDGALKIAKLDPVNQEAIYEFGGLQAPAAGDEPLMMEFTLLLNLADVSVDPFESTGVLVGLKCGGAGVVVKFCASPSAQRIELHNAIYSTIAPPSSLYRAEFPWDGTAYTYKLLWHPRLNQLKLYVSAGQDSEMPDLLLIDGHTDVFQAAVLPPNEVPANQPVMYFGHGYPASTSTSYWYGVSLHNRVNTVLAAGLFQGKNTGFIQTNEVIHYDASVVPKDAMSAWTPLPSGFGTIAGEASISTNQRLHLLRTSKTASFGFHRMEPSILLEPTIFDFRVSGELLYRDSAAGDATGMELFVGNARVALLDAGAQAIGIYTGTIPSRISSYTAREGNWINEYDYRLIYDPAGQARLFRMVTAEEGVDEDLVVGVPVIDLPTPVLDSMHLGFLHNATTIEALARLKIGRIRYSTNVRLLDGLSLPSSPWALIGSGYGQTTASGFLILNHDTFGSAYHYYRHEDLLNSSKGSFVEFRARVDSYATVAGVNPTRELTGVGIAVDDGSYQNLLMFADAGGSIGKIVFLATSSDLSTNLFNIRAGFSSVEGTYTQVDWTHLHIYRLEKKVGGRLALYIDDADEPAIVFDTHLFQGIPTWGDTLIRFGSLLSTHKSHSTWQFFRHSVSTGFEVAGFPVMPSTEVLNRFNSSINFIAEAGS